MSYLIYLPGRHGAGADNLADVGLASLGPDFETRDVLMGGPDGGGGILVAWGFLPTLALDAQEWTPAKRDGQLPEGRFWMGKQKGEKITPESLLRKEHFGSTRLMLDDDQEWLIPVAKRLPHRYTLKDGVPVRKVKEAYQNFYERSLAFYYQFRDYRGVGEEVTLPAAWTFAIEALALDYRVDENIVDWLGLLGDVTIIRLIGATFEFDTIEALSAQKKTDSPGILAT